MSFLIKTRPMKQEEQYIELIPMVKYVINLCKDDNFVPNILNAKKGFENYWSETFNYAKFLKKPLELSMFIPTDKDGNVLDEPDCYETWENNTIDLSFNADMECNEYKEALERVIFEAPIIINNGINLIRMNIRNKNLAYSKRNKEFLYNNKTIEDLVNSRLRVKQSAIKG